VGGAAVGWLPPQAMPLCCRTYAACCRVTPTGQVCQLPPAGMWCIWVVQLCRVMVAPSMVSSCGTGVVGRGLEVSQVMPPGPSARYTGGLLQSGWCVHSVVCLVVMDQGVLVVW
jgi:hypothetical protein